MSVKKSKRFRVVGSRAKGSTEYEFFDHFEEAKVWALKALNDEKFTSLVVEDSESGDWETAALVATRP